MFEPSTIKKHEFLFNINRQERFEARSKQLPRHDCQIRLDFLDNWHLNTRHKKYAIRKNPILRSILFWYFLFFRSSGLRKDLELGWIPNPSWGNFGLILTIYLKVPLSLNSFSFLLGVTCSFLSHLSLSLLCVLACRFFRFCNWFFFLLFFFFCLSLTFLFSFALSITFSFNFFFFSSVSLFLLDFAILSWAPPIKNLVFHFLEYDHMTSQ